MATLKDASDKKSSNVALHAKNVDLLELLAICYDLALKSGEKICEVFESGDLHVRDKAKRDLTDIDDNKTDVLNVNISDNINNNNNNNNADNVDNDNIGIDIDFKMDKIINMPKLSRCETLLGDAQFSAKDPETIADIIVQHLIENGIHSIYPNITIKGEENLTNVEKEREYIKKHFVDYDDDKNIIKISKILPNKYNDLLIKNKIINDKYSNLNINDIVIWIDPLDGTKCYVMAPKDNEAAKSVTCLIGIAYKSHPIAGIINCPFNNNNTSFAICDIGVFGINNYENIVLNEDYFLNKLKRDASRRYIAASMIYDKKKDVLDYFDKYCFPQKVIKMGGAGNKILSIIRNEADAYVKISPGTKKWDICAPQAYINAIGGKLTDKFGDLYTFNHDVNVENINGIVATWTTKNKFHQSFLYNNKINNKIVNDADDIVPDDNVNNNDNISDNNNDDDASVVDPTINQNSNDDNIATTILCLKC